MITWGIINSYIVLDAFLLLSTYLETLETEDFHVADPKLDRDGAPKLTGHLELTEDGLFLPGLRRDHPPPHKFLQGPAAQKSRVCGHGKSGNGFCGSLMSKVFLPSLLH